MPALAVVMIATSVAIEAEEGGDRTTVVLDDGVLRARENTAGALKRSLAPLKPRRSPIGIGIPPLNPQPASPAPPGRAAGTRGGGGNRVPESATPAHSGG